MPIDRDCPRLATSLGRFTWFQPTTFPYTEVCDAHIYVETRYLSYVSTKMLPVIPPAAPYNPILIVFDRQAGRQRGGLRGVSQDPDRRQSGGVALGLVKSGDVVSRRRSQETPSARGRGHSGTRDQSESTERRGLLSPIGET